MIKREEIRWWKKGTLSNPRMGHQGWVEQKKSLQENNRWDEKWLCVFLVLAYILVWLQRKFVLNESSTWILLNWTLSPRFQRYFYDLWDLDKISLEFPKKPTNTQKLQNIDDDIISGKCLAIPNCSSVSLISSVKIYWNESL